jgi:hypothetical protein
MKAVSLQGPMLSWSFHGLDVDPLADLLALLDPTPASANDLAAASKVHFDLRPATIATAADPLAEGFVPSFFHGAVQAYRGPTGFLLWDRSSRVLVPSDGSSAQGELCPPDQERYAGSSAVLLQIAVTLALRHARLFHLHAAAVRHTTGTAVIIAGASGAGKTTTALALLEAGCDNLGDDALFLAQAAAPAPELEARAIAFPRPFHLGPTTLAAFPRLAPFAEVARSGTDKRSLDPRRAFPGRHRPAIPLRRGATLAIFPSIEGGQTSSLVAVSKADALGHLLAASAALIVEGIARRDENLALLRALVSAASGYELRLGEDAIETPSRVIAARIDAACQRLW